MPAEKLFPETWVDRYSDYLYNYTIVRVNDHEVAQDLISDSTNTLEIGKTDKLAYRIYLKAGKDDKAQTAYESAEKIFAKLDATFFLEQLYKSVNI